MAEQLAPAAPVNLGDLGEYAGTASAKRDPTS